jgi:hypothetical protein
MSEQHDKQRDAKRKAKGSKLKGYAQTQWPARDRRVINDGGLQRAVEESRRLREPQNQRKERDEVPR